MFSVTGWRGGADLQTPIRAALSRFFPAVGKPKLHEALKQLAEVKTNGSGLTRHKAGGGHAGQGIDLQQRKAVVRPENKVCPAVAPEAERPVRGKGQFLHARGQCVTDGGRAYFTRAVLCVLAFVIKKISGYRLDKDGRQGLFAQNAAGHLPAAPAP